MYNFFGDKGYEDDVTAWWTNLLAVACYWLLAEECKAEKLYFKVDNIPQSLLELDDPLPKAALAAFTAQRTNLRANSRNMRAAAFHQCNRASQLVDESLTYGNCRQHSSKALVSIFVICVISFDING